MSKDGGFPGNEDKDTHFLSDFECLDLRGKEVFFKHLVEETAGMRQSLRASEDFNARLLVEISGLREAILSLIPPRKEPSRTRRRDGGWREPEGELDELEADPVELLGDEPLDVLEVVGMEKGSGTDISELVSGMPGISISK